MSAILLRSVLAPLKLCPDAFCKVQVLLSPSLTPSSSSSSKATAAINGNGDAHHNDSISSFVPSPPFIPSTYLPEIIQQCSSLWGPSATYTPSPHLPTGHAQTIYSAGADTVMQDVVHYKRRVILVPDGGIITLDVAEKKQDEAADKETIVILHGLTGGSQESYVRHCVKKLLDGPGYRCIVVNFRGCANTPITSPQLYSASKTSDLRCALLFIQSLYPKSPLVGLSFSLGANVLAKYLGEEGDDTALLAGISCAAPFHLKKGSNLLEESFFRRLTYSRAMNGNLTRVARRHAATLDLDETLHDPLDDLLDAKRAQARTKLRGKEVANSKDTLKFVDDTIVGLVGGHKKPYGEFPFDSADAYYRQGGALNTLKGLKRPLLALNGDDDPIVASESIAGIRHLMGWHDPKEEEDLGHTEYIALATTHGGGHLGWWEGYKKRERWLYRPVIDFSKAIFEKSKQLQRGKEQVDVGSDRKNTSTVEVLVELMPSEVLPAYIEVKDRGAKIETKEVGKLDTKFNKGPRLPWLRTHLLKEAVLVHPSMSRHGWCGQEPASQADFSMNERGRVDPQDEAKIKGWCAFTAQMVIDSVRPEVGYLEMPAWTRVAGSGEEFQGGKDVPGLYGEKVETSDGTIAGL